MPPSSFFSFGIHTISVLLAASLRSPFVSCFLSHDIPVFHTFCMPSKIPQLPWYIIPTLVDTSYQRCLFYSTSVPSIIRCTLDFSFILFTMSLVVLPYMLLFSSSCLLFSFFLRGHFLYLCSFSLYLKHSTTISSYLFIILFSTSHCIILLVNILNLFWKTIFSFSFSPLFLQFWTRCPNFL